MLIYLYNIQILFVFVYTYIFSVVVKGHHSVEQSTPLEAWRSSKTSMGALEEKVCKPLNPLLKYTKCKLMKIWLKIEVYVGLK